MRLKPKQSKTLAELPLGFEAGEDFQRGTYDLNDKNASGAQIDKALRALGPGKHTIVIPMAYRMPGDPPTRLRRRVIRKTVIGPLNAEELARIVYEAARAIHESPEP